MHSRLIAVVLIAPIVYASSRALRGSPPSGVCTPATNSSGWLFATPQDSGESCKSSAGGTNDLGSTPEMCSNDVTSVRIGLAQGKAECLVAVAPQCKIPMHEFVSLDYNFAMDGCMGVWAAPLWLTLPCSEVVVQGNKIESRHEFSATYCLLRARKRTSPEFTFGALLITFRGWSNSTRAKTARYSWTANSTRKKATKG